MDGRKERKRGEGGEKRGLEIVVIWLLKIGYLRKHKLIQLKKNVNSGLRHFQESLVTLALRKHFRNEGPWAFEHPSILFVLGPGFLSHDTWQVRRLPCPIPGSCPGSWLLRVLCACLPGWLIRLWFSCNWITCYPTPAVTGPYTSLLFGSGLLTSADGYLRHSRRGS